ncbi:MAG: molybdopterin-dependent oxidoreductase [Thermodesulfovibrionales bacterium]
MIEITINGKKMEVEPKTTILQAAKANGIYIPHLCWDRRLKPYGGCRLCLVEVEGQRKLLASCSTPAENGMVIQTETPKLHKARKTVLELLLVHHPLDCPICDKAGECELQELAFKYGPAESRFVGERKHAPESTAAPLVERNPNRCILCGKCVRVCGEHQGVGAINLIGRGFKTIVSPAFEETLDCEFCGQCIDACPVGALGSKPYRFRSRVWFMEEVDTVCSHCGSGCTLTLGVKEGRIVRARGEDGRGISKGDLCGKGRFGFDYVYSEKRLSMPMIRRGAELEPATWEEALFFIGERLSAIRAEYGPDAIGGIGSQRVPVEDNYMLQKFMREVVGTNNLDSSARFGYARAQEAMKRTFGVDALPIRFDSPLEADVMLVLESDVTSTHPVFGLNMLRARRDFGARLIVADPKSTKLTRHSTSWLRVRPGTSSALAMGMMAVMLEEGLYDKEREKLPGFDALKASLKGYSAEKAAQASGVGADEIRAAARTFAAGKNRLLAITMGGAENTKGMNTVLAAANLLLLAGSGPEAFQMPAEFSNTLGLFEAGVRPDKGPGHSDLQGERGVDIYGMLYGKDSPLKALYIMGENPVVTFPRARLVEGALERLELLVVQDIMMTETARFAHVVLPAASWSEREGTFLGAAGVAQRAVKCIPETGLSVPDWQILRNLARSMQKDLGARDLEELRAEIAGKTPLDFSGNRYSLAFTAVADTRGEEVSEEYPFSMVTGTLMQHSGSLTTLSKSLGSVVSDAYLQISVPDAARLGVRSEGFVKLVSRRGEVFLKAIVTDEVPEGMLFVPAHFPHARVNALTYAPSNGEAPVVAARVEPA